MPKFLDPRRSLEDRFRAIHDGSDMTFRRELHGFVEFIERHKRLRAIMLSLEARCPETDGEAWFKEHFNDWRWPNDEAQCAKIAWWFVRNMAPNPMFIEQVRGLVRTHARFQLNQAGFANMFVLPVTRYLLDHLDSDSEILYLLARYKHRTEWFDQALLLERYAADTKHGESIYDDDLQRFLFDRDVDVYRQPSTPSGRADFVAGLESNDPMVCEVKLFEPARNYGVGYVAKGFGQARRYAVDLQKPVAHLVVFNLTDHVLELPSDDPDQWPSRVHVDSVTVYVVTVQAKQLASASTSGKTRAYTVTRDDLIGAADPA